MITGASFMVGVNLIFLDPILVLRLADLGMNQDNTGLGFACMGTTYVFGAMVISGFVSQIDARKIVCSCLIIMGIFLLCASGIITQSLTQTFIGLGGFGFFLAGIFVP
jgi:predicted MFS family arabinose efflux permease